jgi:hypothetical protein
MKVVFSHFRDAYLVTLIKDVALKKKEVKAFIAKAADAVGKFDFKELLGPPVDCARIQAALESEAAASVRSHGKEWSTMTTDVKALVDFIAATVLPLGDGTGPSQCMDNLRSSTDGLKGDIEELGKPFARCLGNLTGLQAAYKTLPSEQDRGKLADRCLMLLGRTSVMTADTEVLAILEALKEAPVST